MRKNLLNVSPEEGNAAVPPHWRSQSEHSGQRTRAKELAIVGKPGSVRPKEACKVTEL